jgi:hypothetical protein
MKWVTSPLTTSRGFSGISSVLAMIGYSLLVGLLWPMSILMARLSMFFWIHVGMLIQPLLIILSMTSEKMQVKEPYQGTEQVHTTNGLGRGGASGGGETRLLP